MSVVRLAAKQIKGVVVAEGERVSGQGRRPLAAGTAMAAPAAVGRLVQPQLIREAAIGQLAAVHHKA